MKHNNNNNNNNNNNLQSLFDLHSIEYTSSILLHSVPTSQVCIYSDILIASVDVAQLLYWSLTILSTFFYYWLCSGQRDIVCLSAQPLISFYWLEIVWSMGDCLELSRAAAGECSRTLHCNRQGDGQSYNYIMKDLYHLGISWTDSLYYCSMALY